MCIRDRWYQRRVHGDTQLMRYPAISFLVLVLALASALPLGGEKKRKRIEEKMIQFLVNRDVTNGDPLSVAYDDKTKLGSITFNLSQQANLTSIFFNYSRDDIEIGESIDRILSIEHVKHDRLEIVRCSRLTNEELLSQNYTKIGPVSTIDTLDDWIEEEYKKKGFEFRFIGPDKNWFLSLPKPSSFSCHGVRISGLPYRELRIYRYTQKFARDICWHIDKYFYTTKIHDHFQIEEFSFNTRVYYTNTSEIIKFQTQFKGFINEISNIPWVRPQFIRNVSSTLWVIDEVEPYNKFFHVFHAETDPKTYLSEVKNFTFRVPSYRYSGTIQKRVVGEGLHQRAAVRIQARMNKTNVPKPVLKQGCYFAFLEFIDETQYIDQEEFPVPPYGPELNTFSRIDIEKPSTLSNQHYYIIYKEIFPEQIKEEGDTFVIDHEFRYPIHFRYQNSSNVSYANSYVNRKPRVYWSCMEKAYSRRPRSHDLLDQLIEERTRGILHNVEFNYERREVLFDDVSIPVGRESHSLFIRFGTIGITLGAAIFFAIALFKVRLL
eukprot:TRINITY_DN8125_c0_g2_i1.p1 TRINITY_DN8125_c0_g2~~TRINITY_DN8125_c0_g2_i1.p1  ORF type:complete len:548 (+),score=124.36 TRINITY_DN8125_c0_g2_i1:78-1721(+)